MTFKTIKDFDLHGKTVLLRADLKGYSRHEMAVFVGSNLVQPRPRIVRP